MLVVDSTVLVEHLRGNAPISKWLGQERARGHVLVPTLVAWELWTGARSPRQNQMVASLLAALESDPFTPALAHLAGELHRQTVAAGRRRPTIDLLIASHAILHDAPLATIDRDYAEIPDLELIALRPNDRPQ